MLHCSAYSTSVLNNHTNPRTENDQPVESSKKIQTEGGKSEKLNNIITNINIKTTNKNLKRQINKILSKYKNKQFSKKLSDKIYNEILNSLKEKKILLPEVKGPLFDLTNNRINISYEITNSYKYGFILKGNKALDRYTLLPKKNYEKHFNNNQLIRKILTHIKESYLKKGYSNIDLNHQVKIDHKHFIKTIFITINEGRPTEVEEIKIFGQFSKADRHYINLIRHYSGSLIRKGLFYNTDIQKGLKNLVNSLKNEGYLKATAHARITNTSDNKVIIGIILNEGPLTKVKALSFKGNKYFSNQQLMNIMKIKVNEGFNINILEQSIKNLISAYRDAGFIEMKLNNKEKIVQYDRKDSTATLHINITESIKIKISDILIKGNKITKKELIITGLPVKKGDILTPKKIELSINKLRNLGIFSSINILTKNDNNKPEERILIIQVEERKPRSIRFSLGVNTERTLTARGFAEFSNRNILGTGRHIFSRVKLQSNIAKHIQISSSEPEYLEHQASISYIEPFLFKSGFNGQINLSNSDQIFSHLQTKEGSITDIVESTQINFLLKRTINNFINLTWTILSWEGREKFTKTRNCQISKSSKSNAILCDNDILNIASTGISLSIDKRDNILSTSDGFLSQMSIEYAGPFYIINSSEEIKFIKMEVKHFDFRPLFSNWVWVNSIHGGFITNMNSLNTGGFPVSRAFILGGVNSLRGFDGLIHGERVPDKNELPIDNANELISSRASFYMLLKTELRFSISTNFIGTLFYDGGIVTISGKNFERPYRHSAGFGLRYKTPLGPIAGYIAFKISPKKDEFPVVPHLSFGSF